MELVQELGSHAWTAGQPLTAIELLRIPEKYEGEEVYVAGIYADLNITDIDNAGGSVTNPELHAIVDQFTVYDGKKAWGPEQLDGLALAHLYYKWTGQAIPFQTDSNGDSDVGAGSNGTRRWVFAYRYDRLGAKPSDFAPHSTSIRKGHILVRASALPTNATALTATITYTAHLFTSKEKRAVPRVVSQRNQFNSLDMVQPFAGKLADLSLQNAGDWVRADATKVELFTDEGAPIEASIQDLNLTGSDNPTITSARQQRHFSETIGGTDPRFFSLIPFNPAGGRRVPVSEMLESSSYRIKITGTETATNVYALATLIERMDPLTIVDRLAKCGCDRGAIASKAQSGLSAIGYYKTASKMPLREESLFGYLPFKLDPKKLAA